MTRMRFGQDHAAQAAQAANWPRWLWMSLAVHVLILLAWWIWKSNQPTLEPGQVERIEATRHKEGQVRMQRKLQALEQMQSELAGSQPPSSEELAAQDAALSGDPKLMLERAKAIAAQIDQHDQQQRAQELARKQRIPVAKALEQVRRADAAQAASAPRAGGDTNRQLADLAEHARHTLAAQRQRSGEPGGASGTSGNGNTDSVAGGRGAGRNGSAGSAGPGSWNTPLTLDNAFLDQRDYGPMMPTPFVDPNHLALASGRTLGPGGMLADRAFLDSWYLIGPFGGQGAASHDRVYPPELGVDLDAVYEGKNGTALEWHYLPGAAYPLVPPPRAENAVYYAYTEIRVDRDTNLWFNVGSDDDSKMWVNDDLVWSSNQGDKAWYRQPFYRLRKEIAQYNLVEGRVRVHLHPGANRVLFKLYNGIDLMFFAVVLTP
ncbi:MAG: cell envelope integrity protein TolA [Paucibacter sp.]|nr:cell envelope integrity protein TolA [Roseateles sp.]